MNIIEIIEKKKNCLPLNRSEIDFFVNGYTKGEIPDYQISSLLMAIRLNGMNDEEIFYLTDAMLNSGDKVDLSNIKGITVDKHSTGGVGDKTSLLLCPLVACLGAKVAKMSGRGLAHTGGTLDKLESIPGTNINVDIDDFIKQVNDIGIAIIGQNKSLCPADKKLYALRDVTGTVDSIPLISSSVMSKKLASGSEAILLDVTLGSGAFMKDEDSANKLAKTMVNIGKSYKKDIRAIVTNMDEPLGFAVGNSLEVIEVVNALKGNGPKDLMELTYFAGGIMLQQAHIVNNYKDAYKLFDEAINSEAAFSKFKEMISLQGGDTSYLDDVNKFEKSKHIIEIKSKESGYIKRIDALNIGIISMKLGAGRYSLEDKIDMSAGIVLNKKVSSYVNEGEVLLTLYTNKDNYEELYDMIYDSFSFSKEKIDEPKVVISYINE